MINIDLLKGKGVPVKSRPINAVWITVLFLVPILVSIPMVCAYLGDGVRLKTKREALALHNSKIQQLQGTKDFLCDIEMQHRRIGESLVEVAKCINVHSPWSPVLAAVAQSVPESLSLDRLALRRMIVKKPVPNPDSPGSTTLVPGYQFSLEIYTSAGPENAVAMKEFVHKLRASYMLGSRLEDCRMESRPVAGEDDYVSYAIYCIFQPKIAGV